MSRPVFTLIAGANGAGKSTLSRSGSGRLNGAPIFDPDLIASALVPSKNPATTQIAAGRELLTTVEKHIRSRVSFAVETMLSGKLYLNMMSRTRQLGYENILIYIGTANVEINLARVANRVSLGGHDVPEEDVRRRYARSLQNLPLAVRLADRAMLLDNSEETGYQLVGVIENGIAEWLQALPQWAAALQV